MRVAITIQACMLSTSWLMRPLPIFPRDGSRARIYLTTRSSSRGYTILALLHVYIPATSTPPASMPMPNPATPTRPACPPATAQARPGRRPGRCVPATAPARGEAAGQQALQDGPADERAGDGDGGARFGLGPDDERAHVVRVIDVVGLDEGRDADERGYCRAVDMGEIEG
ncbi:MAG: hypothetical protein LQ340_007809 [Diploschistes diacapsis]|nr:MAG: hypothetical protein LQ340_007809 [Diploschistes diacapsis]